MQLSPRDRERFDQQLEQVLAELPPMVHELLEQVPLLVEDHPSQKILYDLGISSPDELCGLYTGVPLIDRSVDHSGLLPDCVTIYRAGLLRLATGPGGRISPRELRRQIRITILHELGHYHGFDEDELEELGYG
jgi:predicted Zn-dependent protease with MMP-like domain